MTHIAVLLGLLLATGCGASLRPKYPIQSARDVLQRREATTAALQSIRAEARVDQRAQQGRIRGTVLMLIEQSGRVRFDVMTQFGPIAILTSDGKQFAYSDFRAKRYLTGETCPLNIARLLGIPLSAEETARFLLGGTPVIAYDRAELTSTDEGHYRLLLMAAAGDKQEIVLAVYPSDLQLPAAQQRLYLVRSELFRPGGARVWRVSYDEPSKVGELFMPMRVRIEQTSPASDTLVHFKTVASNPHIPDDVFVQAPRPGMEEELASCE